MKSGRDFLPNLGVRFGLTVLLMVLVFIAFLAVVVAGPLLARSPKLPASRASSRT